MPQGAQGPRSQRRRRRRPGGKRRGGRGRRSQRGPDALREARRLARRRFGIGRLRPEQEEAMSAVLGGRDALVVLPTGYGKSLIYQVPALLLPGPTVVVSPLIALMRDQERALRSRGAPVGRLDSTLTARQRRETLNRVRKGGPLIVLTTPETLESADAGPALREGRPSLLCVDEAHCISEWGHDFRPAYLRLAAERAALGIGQVLALTATATPHVRQDVADRLGMQDPVEVVAPPHRANLQLAAEIVPGGFKIQRAGRMLRRLTRPGVVYCSTKRAVDEIYPALVRARIPCARYHGGMKRDERNDQQRKFMKSGRRMVMVATSAFGMGIDKPDIRYIVHYQAPGSPEQYVQEAGRAGRDGRPARCILLFDPGDVGIHEYLWKRSNPTAAQLRRVARALAAWAAEERAVAAKELAVSAEVPVTICRSLCAQLEELGLVAESRRRYAALVPPPRLSEAAEDLAARLEIKRRQDARRLRAVGEYAETETCRSVFLRRWFGEEDPPRCGRCDRCRQEDGSPERPRRCRGG